MKNLKLNLATLALTMLTTNTTAFSMGGAPVNTNEGEVTQVKNISSENTLKTLDPLRVYLSSQREIRALERKIGVNEVIAESEMQLNKVFQETVTDVSEYSSTKKIISWIFLILDSATSKGGNSEASIIAIPDNREEKYSSRSVKTSMLLQNADEVSSFPIRLAQDGKNLEKKILSHIEQNAESIVAMKIHGILAMKAAFELRKSNGNSPISVQELEETILRLKKIRFLGEQRVNICTTKNFIDFVKFSESYSVNTSFSGGVERSSSDTQKAHTVKNCEDTKQNYFSKDASESILSIDLALLDRVLDEWLSAINAAYLFGHLGEKPQALFNNSYLK